MKINLLVEYFESSSSERKKEYIECLEMNINNPFIDKIYIFNTDNLYIRDLSKKNEKVVSVNTQKRMTYADFFDFSNQKLIGEISIISNLDIILDTTIQYINNITLDNFFLCLTRYDIKRDGTTNFPPNHFGTQDTWIYKAPIKTFGADFYLGIPGCDNRITYVMEKNGCVISNPSLQIVTKHLHLTNYRTYDNGKDTIFGEYIYLLPTNDVNKLSPKKYVYNKNGIISEIK